MKALVKARPEKGADLLDIDVPRVGPNDLLVRVQAAAICGTDNHIYEWTPWAQARLPLPMIFGHEYAGEVVEVGSAVRGFAVGDMVAAETHIPCLQCRQCRTGRQHTCEEMKIIGVHVDGAFSEYALLPESCAWKLPPGTSPELGAILEPIGVAANGLFKDRVDGLSVAVIGCGPIGIFCAQMAAAAGARQLFVTDVNAYRLDMARRIVPDAVVLNPLQDDVPAIVADATSGRGVEVAVELSGSQAGTEQAFDLLAKGGRVSLVGLPSRPITLEMTEAIIYREAVVYGSTGRLMWDTWYQVDGLLQQNKFDPLPVITHRFPLEEYAQALELTMSGEAGKVILAP
ncbi:MAG TPA: L-threonine 3-dehydrogenase [Chloroflexi bacterium]|jgi:threonine 3-dehydrogenase|nr:L-threonine 3-dehydrogenase [Chloroflexota bacterium]